MKCSDCEKLIYLYKELDSNERQKLEAHLLSCTSCSARFEQFQKNQMMISAAVKDVPGKFKNENPFLTAKIMSAIQKDAERTKVSIIERFLPVFRFQPLRYAFALISFALIVMFVVEIDPAYQTKSVVSFYRQIPIKKTVQLNSRVFAESVRNSIRSNQSQPSFSFAGCLDVCREDAQENNCETCLSRLNKIKQNEGI